MSDNQSDPEQPNREPASEKLTAFGEPRWLDALKTIGVGITMLTIVIVLGGILGVAIIAPWGRASHDCSIYCVIRRYFGLEAAVKKSWRDLARRQHIALRHPFQKNIWLKYRSFSEFAREGRSERRSLPPTYTS